MIENDQLRVEVLPEKGSDIIGFVHKPTGTDVLWHSPTGLRPASSFLGDYLDTYEGGWQEFLPNGGAATRYRGANLPFHGETGRLPWSTTVLSSSGDRVEVALEVRTVRLPLYLRKVIGLDAASATLTIDETLVNESPDAIELMWGHHPAFGPPFLDDSCWIDAPATLASTRRGERLPGSGLRFDADFAWPIAPLDKGGSVDLRVVPPVNERRHEWVYLSGLQGGWYGITNRRRQIGFALSWDPTVFPYVWFWQDWGGSSGYPSWGRGYACALEPWTSWPDAGLSEAILNGSAMRVDPWASITTRLRATIYTGVDGIDGVDPDGIIRAARPRR